MSSVYLTVSEASEYLKIPEETLYKYARNGQIPASKVGRYWRFDQTKIDHWVRDHSNQERQPLRVLIIDDDPSVRSFFTRWLTDEGCDVMALPDGSDAEFTVQQHGSELVLLDLYMPSPNGVETLAILKQAHPDVPVVIVTAYCNSTMMEQAWEQGPLTLLKKPVTRDSLHALLSQFRETSASS